MHPCNKETPLAATGGALSDGLEGLSLNPSSLAFQRAQFLMSAHAIRPDLALMLGGLIFEGGAQ
ncbi:hypothetical protein EH31_09215 [Erythrobacter longus]|uniref:Uncharacterized protein n=1 Tax=Erythrobacter longus TaxID=1044 RepID=A0A074MA09_ERYLO|nr:hypothetical protein [Erythrobacter longus]KEO90259.1 hypothetical protein EH31_09215 [Erythrobacter longus]